VSVQYSTVLFRTCGVVGDVVLHSSVERRMDDHAALFAVENEIAVHHTSALLVPTQVEVERVPAQNAITHGTIQKITVAE